jgi:ABC-type branched-subunit amino acid transport system permease subunit
MNLPLFISRLLVIVVLALISYSLTGSIAVRSTMGIILAIVSLGATAVFLYLLPKLYQHKNEEEGAQR